MHYMSLEVYLYKFFQKILNKKGYVLLSQVDYKFRVNKMALKRFKEIGGSKHTT